MKIVCTILLFWTTSVVSAQEKKEKKYPFTPPKLFTQLGGLRDSAAVADTTAIKMIKQPLIVNDGKSVYKISSYNVLYKQKNIFLDEQSGKRIVSYTTNAQLFKSTPLTPIWIKALSEQLHSGDELLYFSVIVTDNKDRVMNAPDFKIKIK